MIKVSMIEPKSKIAPDEVCRRGEEIYARIKNQYLPQYKGKYLVIEVESGKVYVGDSSVQAAEQAFMEDPEKMSLHTVRIGYKYPFFLAGLMEDDEMVD